jgi:hypothetical protein
LRLDSGPSSVPGASGGPTPTPGEGAIGAR